MRQPFLFANYPTTAITDDVIGDVMGPNAFGERLVVVSREVVDGKTRLGFVIANSEDVAAYAEKLAAQR